MGIAAAYEVLVIGSGVAGLTTAVRLAEAGRTVRVVAARPPLRTTSAVAGASWGPYLVSDERVLRWSQLTRLALTEIAKEPSSGVRLVSGIEAAPHPMQPPSWAIAVPDFRCCGTDELPDGYVSGWRYTIPLVDMPRYLRYLSERLNSSGVPVELGTVRSFAELAGRARTVVNCTGLGARTLVPDPTVHPIRGQLVVVANPGLETFFQDQVDGSDITCIFPHGDHVVLGGSAVPGSVDLAPDPATAAAIIDRCAAIEPRLRVATVLGHRVGLRPGRPAVRVELDTSARVPIVHNYGHGGAGLTLSWGCADEVVALCPG